VIDSTAGDAAAATGTQAPPARPRPARRSPAALPFTFADAALAEAIATERGEPDWLRVDRLAGAAAIDALPTEGNQLYTPYIDLRAAKLEGARPYLRTASAAATTASAGTGLPEGAAGVIEIVEDGVGTVALTPEAVAAGVTLETFGAAFERDPDGLRADLEGGRSLPSNDRLAALARGFWSQGVRLIVPAGVRLDRPIVIRWRSSRPERALIGRSVIRLGDGARASVVEEIEPSGPPIACAAGEEVPQGLFAGTAELTLGRDAHLAFASIQDLRTSQVAFAHRHASIGEGATLHWALAQLGSKLVRSRVDNRLEGDRSSVEQVEIVFGGEDQLFDLTSYTRHIGRDTTGNLLSKGALLDRARSYMKGLITIEKSAVGTDSFLGEFGMNLSRAARAVAIPSLEIDQPDCRRAAHSSSVGPIDEGQRFYLETRGIPPDEARKFIVLGFLEPVVARMPLEGARERLRSLLEEKWAASGGMAAASGASAA